MEDAGPLRELINDQEVIKELAGLIVLEDPSRDKGRFDVGYFVGGKYYAKGEGFSDLQLWGMIERPET